MNELNVPQTPLSVNKTKGDGNHVHQGRVAVDQIFNLKAPVPEKKISINSTHNQEIKKITSNFNYSYERKVMLILNQTRFSVFQSTFHLVLHEVALFIFDHEK